MSEFMAHYERKYSDQNYGSEGLSLSWSWEADGEEASGEALEEAVGYLKKMVLTELSKSTAGAVASAARFELGKLEQLVSTTEPASLEDLPF